VAIKWRLRLWFLLTCSVLGKQLAHWCWPGIEIGRCPGARVFPGERDRVPVPADSERFEAKMTTGADGEQFLRAPDKLAEQGRNVSDSARRQLRAQSHCLSATSLPSSRNASSRPR
jgi:hypothetical protein